MRKRIIAFCAAAAMALSCASQVFAAPTELENLITALPNYDTDYKTVSVDVPADIELRTGTSGEFADGPIVRSVLHQNVSLDISYRATLYMQTVQDEFNTYWASAKALINIAKEAKIAGGESEADATAFADTLLTQLNEVPVTGTFTVEVTFPNTITIPDSVKNGSNMDGFNDEAKQIFKEVSRTATSTGLKIEIAVKGPDETNPRDYVTGSELYDDGNFKYLPDLVFTCEGAKVKGLATHKVTGSITGSTKIGDYEAVTGVAQEPISTINYKAVQITAGHPGDANRDAADGIYESVRLYIDENQNNNTNTGGGSTVTRPSNTPVPVSTVKPQDPESDAELDKENHYAYIIGDDEGNVRPMADISRAEVATIFFRLFTDDTRTKYWSKTNTYSDVAEGDWYNNAISTLSNAKVLTGYEDGTFKPNAPITRAEFAAIVSRLTDGIYEGYDLFDDIKNSWAREYINRASYKGWVQGDGNKKYRPADNITRAEAMTLINNVLIRHVEESGMYAEMNKWPDNQPSAWYYTAVQEATNSHNYERIENSENEKWSTPLEDRDWAALEKAWADANN